jgi:hypothetical protein
MRRKKTRDLTAKFGCDLFRPDVMRCKVHNNCSLKKQLNCKLVIIFLSFCIINQILFCFLFISSSCLHIEKKKEVEFYT